MVQIKKQKVTVTSADEDVELLLETANNANGMQNGSHF